MFLYCKLCFKWVFFAFFQTLLLNTEVNICNFLYKVLTKLRKFKHKFWKTHVFGNIDVKYWSQNLQFHSSFLTKLHKFRQKFSKTHVFCTADCAFILHFSIFCNINWKLKSTSAIFFTNLHKFKQKFSKTPVFCNENLL